VGRKSHTCQNDELRITNPALPLGLGANAGFGILSFGEGLKRTHSSIIRIFESIKKETLKIIL